MKKSRQAIGRKTSHRIKLSTIAALGALGLSIDASAQGTASDPIDAIEGISNYEILPDDTLLITLESGETLTLTSDAYLVVGEQVFLRESGAALVQAAIQSGVSSAGILAAATGLGALGGVSQIDGDDDADPIEVDTTAPEFTSGSSASVAENVDATTVVYDADATDAGTVSYALSGTDSALFEIDSTTGEVTFLEAPDFEAPGDDDGDGVFDITITASDGTNTSSLDVSITLTDENDEAPVFTSAAVVEAVAETATDTVYTATVDDADSDAADIPFSLAEGGDSDFFNIDASTGEVTLKDSVDHENPGDADGDNTYEIQIIASDGTNETTHEVAITITDAGDEAPVFTSENSASTAENTTDVVYTAQAAPDVDGAGVTYAIEGGEDAERFTIDEDTGELRFLRAPDYDAAGDEDGDNDYFVTLSATEADGQSATQTVTISVTDTDDEAPVFTSEASVSGVPETARDVVYTAAVTDVDSDAADITFSLADGGDNDYFNINASTGEVTLKSGVDHDNPGDTNGDNTYEIQIIADDGANETTHEVAITITDAGDEAPVFTSENSASTAENAADVVYTAQATPDVDGAGVTYAIEGGADAERFTIDQNTGELSFVNAPDYDAAGDADGDNDYVVTLSATEADGQSATQTVTISVTDENDEAPVFTSGTTVSTDEERIDTGYTAQATPDVDGTPIVYSIVGGAHGDLFDIDPDTGELTFITAPDFETPFAGYEAADNMYEVTIQASDGSNDSAQTVIVTVEDIDEFAPVFSNTVTDVNIDENTPTSTVVFDADATDANGADPTTDDAGITYTLSGDDADLFDIDSDTGEVSFSGSRTPPDHENPADEGGDNVYDITISAMDVEGKETDLDVTITVEDTADDDPVFTSPTAASVDENQTDTGYTAQATPDVDSESVTYSIVGGPRSDLFSIDSDTGELTFIAAPDYEAPLLGYATQGFVLYENSGARSLSFTEAEYFILHSGGGSGNGEFEVGERLKLADRVDSLTYVGTVEIGGHTMIVTSDLAGFSIRVPYGIDPEGIVWPDNFNELTLSTEPYTLEPSNDYFVEIQAGDESGNTSTQTVTITVTDEVGDGPSFANPLPRKQVDEDVTGTVHNASAQPEFEGGTVTYELVLDAGDSDLFSIDEVTGELSFISPPDFEDPKDDNLDNLYVVTIRAIEEGGGVATQIVSIQVLDLEVLEGGVPTISAPAEVDVYEGSESAFSFSVVDPDKPIEPLSLNNVELSGPDAALFEIRQLSDIGQLPLLNASFITAPDHETPLDDGQDNIYNITLTVTDDQGQSSSEDVQITVNDLADEDPVFTSTATASVTEGGTETGYQAAADPDVDGASVTYSITGGDDANLFTISDTGEVSFLRAPVYNDGGDNTYEIAVSATETGGQTSTQTVTITVTEDPSAGSQPPSFTSGTTGSVQENADTSTVVYTATANDPDADNSLLEFSLAAGGDDDLFSIDPDTGEVRFNASPDHEAPGDGDDDNEYEITILVKDEDDNSVSQDVTITVEDIADDNPVFTSPATASVDENETDTGYTAQATPDVDGEGIRYSIVDGLHGDLFSIDRDTGELTFNAAPDHETPNVGWVAGNYALWFGSDITGNPAIWDQGEILFTEAGPPTGGTWDGEFAVGERVAQDGIEYSYTFYGTLEKDGQTLLVFQSSGGSTFAVYGPADTGSGLVDLTGLSLSQVDQSPWSLPETNDYRVEIQARDDSGNTNTQIVTITVDDVPGEAPVFTSPATASVDENETDTGYTAQATPETDGESIEYSIVDGLHGDLFSIDPDTGELTFNAAPDHEAPPLYYASQGYMQYLASGLRIGSLVPVEYNLEEGFGLPIGEFDGKFEVGEILSPNGLGGTTYEGTVEIGGHTMVVTSGIGNLYIRVPSGIDPDGITWPDNFNELILSTDPYTLDPSNDYRVEIEARDESGDTSSQIVTITVDDVSDEDPVFTSDTAASVTEGNTGTGIIPVADPDVDGADVTYSIVGGAHADLFELDPATGELQFISAPDYEAPVSAYAYDGVIAFNSVAAQTVYTANAEGTRVITEDPSSSVGSVNGVLETGEDFLIDGAADGTYRGTISAGGYDLLVSAYEDNGVTYFEIYVPEGVNPDDLGLPSSLPASAIRAANLDLPETNDYQVEIEASDGTNSSTQMVTVSVEDVAESSSEVLSTFGLFTVKLGDEGLGEIEGTVVSAPSDPDTQETPPPPLQDLPKVPVLDWVDDGFAATQMQLDMSDALDGF